MTRRPWVCGVVGRRGYALDYQRNGITGEGFFTVEFDLIEDASQRRLIAIMPQKYNEETETHAVEATSTYVIDPENLNHGFRGDNMGYVLCAWVNENEDAAWPDLYPETANQFPVTLSD